MLRGLHAENGGEIRAVCRVGAVRAHVGVIEDHLHVRAGKKPLVVADVVRSRRRGEGERRATRRT